MKQSSDMDRRETARSRLPEPSTAVPALLLKDVVKRLPSPSRPKFVLDVPRMELARGDVVGVIGPNGSGKTSLLNILAGVWSADEGEIRWGGRLPSDRAVRRELAFVPSKGVPLPKNEQLVRWLAFQARLLGFSRAEARERCCKVLEEVKLAEHARRSIGELSEGQSRRLVLAQAMLGHGRFLVLDEPAESLDPTWREWTYGRVARWSEEGRTVVLASHDLLQLERVVTQVAVLVEGRLALWWRDGERPWRCLMEAYRTAVGADP